MSLINQMLKDLEARRAPALDDAEGEFRGLAWSGANGREPSRAPLLFGFGLAAGLAVFGVAGAWLWQEGIRAEPAPSAVSPEASRPDVAAARPEEAEQAVAAEPPPPVSAAAVAAGASGSTILPPAGDTAAETALAPRDEAVSVAPPVVDAKRAVSAGASSEGTNPPAASPARPAEAEKGGSPARARPSPEKEPPPADDGEKAAAAQGAAVRKTPRPPGPEQQAAAAYDRGYRALSRGDARAAEVALRQALEHRADHRRAREALVGILVDAGRLVEARDLLEEGVRRHPGESRFVRVYGRILAEQGETAAAIAALERGLPVLAADPDYHALLAALYQREGRHGRAARLYRGLVGLRPERGAWWAGLGISLEAQGELQPSRDAFARALRGRDLSPALRDYAKSRLTVLDRR